MLIVHDCELHFQDIIAILTQKEHGTRLVYKEFGNVCPGLSRERSELKSTGSPVHTCNPSTWEVEPGGFPIEDQPRLHDEMLF